MNFIEEKFIIEKDINRWQRKVRWWTIDSPDLLSTENADEGREAITVNMQECDSIGSTRQSPVHMSCRIRGCIIAAVRLPTKVVPSNYIGSICWTLFGRVIPHRKVKAIQDFSIWIVCIIQEIANKPTHSWRSTVHTLSLWWNTVVCLQSARVYKEVSNIPWMDTWLFRGARPRKPASLNSTFAPGQPVTTMFLPRCNAWSSGVCILSKVDQGTMAKPDRSGSEICNGLP